MKAKFVDFKGRPLLRWVGGKSRLAEKIIKKIPDIKNGADYYEPFFGGGGFFFQFMKSDVSKKIKRFFVSDINADLINCYSWIKKEPEGVHDLLRNLSKNVSADDYSSLREEFNEESNFEDWDEKKRLSSIENAARFIYLNRTCFNGVYRVNKDNGFNVPYGKTVNGFFAFPDLKSMKSVSSLLKKCTLSTCSCFDVLKRPKKGDFCYLDPPYHSEKKEAWNGYNPNEFSEKDQENVFQCCKILKSRGSFVMVSNSDSSFIKNLFKEVAVYGEGEGDTGWNFKVISTQRFVASYHSKKRFTTELLITNF